VRDYYSVNEDVVKNIGVGIAESSGKPDGFSLQIHGSGCYGCERHGMSAMLSYRADATNAPVRDFFLGSGSALFFLNQIDAHEDALRARGMALHLDFFLDKDAPLYLHLSPSKTRVFLDQLTARRADIAIGERPDPDFPELSFLARDFKRFSADELPTKTSDLVSAYKFDARDIPLDGLDAGLLLAALYNNAKTGGLGSQHFKHHMMTPAEGRHILSETLRAGALPEFDYINGRSVKAWFGFNEEGAITTLHFSRFWDYNDLPVTFVVAAARSGHYGRLHGQDILDLENEARILMGKDGSRIEGVQELIAAAGLGTDIGAQIDYIGEQKTDGAPLAYQISIAGNGSLRGEIGAQVAPFDARDRGDVSPDLLPPAPVPARNLH